MGESSHCKATQEPVLTCAPSGVHGKEISARTNGQTVIDSMEAQGAIRQVYDRQTDPNERSPLVDPVVTDGVNLRLSGMRERIAQIQEVQTSNEESSTEELETLKALGYVE